MRNSRSHHRELYPQSLKTDSIQKLQRRAGTKAMNCYDVTSCQVLFAFFRIFSVPVRDGAENLTAMPAFWPLCYSGIGLFQGPPRSMVLPVIPLSSNGCQSIVHSWMISTMWYDSPLRLRPLHFPYRMKQNSFIPYDSSAFPRQTLQAPWRMPLPSCCRSCLKR